MSDQEMKSGGGAEMPVVLVEQQSTASRHKNPFRPVDVQEDAPHESHHKRSKAPAGPCMPFAVSEELSESVNPETKERKESERAMSSEKHSKHTVAKKRSSNRRQPAPETIPLQPIDVIVKQAETLPAVETLTPAQPIPKVTSEPTAGLDVEMKKSPEEKDDDSITEEIAELRTPAVAKDTDPWKDIALENKKKEVSWNEGDYLDKVQFEDTSIKKSCILERKSSIGPCFRSSRPFGRPSGISVCLSKKSGCNEIDECHLNQSVINITISKKCLINKTISAIDRRNEKPEADKVKINGNRLTTLRQKVANMGDKIRNVFA